MNQDDRLQQDLLTAAFGDRSEALAAWHHWEKNSHWQDKVDFDAYLLLPRVYHNLGGQGVEDELFGRLKGVIRQNWVANTRRMAMIKALYNMAGFPAEQALLMPPLSLLCHDRSTAYGEEIPTLWFFERWRMPAAATALHASGWQVPDRRIPSWTLHGFAAATPSMCWRHPEYGQLLLRSLPGYESLDSEWAPQESGRHELLAKQPVYCASPNDTVRYLLQAPGLGSGFRRCARCLLYLYRVEDSSAWQLLLLSLEIEASPLLGTVRRLTPDSLATNYSWSTLEAPPYHEPAARRLPLIRKQLQHWRLFRQAIGSERSALDALRALPGYLMGKWDLTTPAQIPRRLLKGFRADIRYRR